MWAAPEQVVRPVRKEDCSQVGGLSLCLVCSGFVTIIRNKKHIASQPGTGYSIEISFVSVLLLTWMHAGIFCPTWSLVSPCAVNLGMISVAIQTMTSTQPSATAQTKVTILVLSHRTGHSHLIDTASGATQATDTNTVQAAA